ncbi:protein-tyrosine phosphatase-like protein [Aspergillus avenaceus]|uniref:Protein-tyrosine phosphatase-like protein n=1 Tax=Aspergillus avenaceus TaxID=36643 RepID=A0A5N6U1K7_ASPAV|nr:protein-tyrosine phosphatase-like protein [Aspergillus avenaceus]
MRKSIDLDSPDRPFDNIINFRDVGRSINSLMGRQVLKEGILFRSARLDDASERDKKRLTDELHIGSIIDLRSSTEHDMATSKRGDGQPSNGYSHLPRLEGVRTHLISLTGKAFERSLLWRLDWWNFLKVLSLAASGNRPAAVCLVGEQVMTPRGLTGLAKDTLDSSTVEMRDIFERVSADGPVLVHCTQGKDRTGLVILMLLLLAGVVSEEALVADYVRSEGELVVEVEERMKEIRKLGLGVEYTRCPGEFVGEISEYLGGFGGVEGYLGSVGVSSDVVDRIRGKLLV